MSKELIRDNGLKEKSSTSDSSFDNVVNKESSGEKADLERLVQELKAENFELVKQNESLAKKLQDSLDGEIHMKTIRFCEEKVAMFLNQELQILDYTQAFDKLFNLEKSAIGIGIGQAEFLGEEVKDFIVSGSKEVLANKLPKEKSILIGNQHYVLKITLSLRDHLNPEISISFMDTEKLISTENELLETNKRLNMALNLENAAIWEWDLAKDEAINYNENWNRIFEFESPKNIIDAFNTRLHPDDKEATWAVISEQLEKGIDNYNQFFRFYNPDMSKVKWLKNSGRVVEKDSKGTPVRIVGITRDVTLEKEAEAALKAANESLIEENQFAQRIMESSAAGMYIFDAQSKENVFANKRTQEILGFSPKELKEMSSETFLSRFHQDDIPKIYEHFQKMESTKGSKQIKYRFKHKDGHYISCLGVDSPFEYDKEGSLKTFIRSFIDISEDFKKEEELIEARNQAVAANRQKDLFLANMSHEIRTPLNAIMGFAHLLQDEELTQKEKKEFGEIINRNSLQLLGLINDIIDLGQIEAGELSINPQAVDLHELLLKLHANYVELVKFKGKEKDLKIELVLPEKSINGEIIEDSVRLEQILNNLVYNAIKFSDQGSIKFGYQLSEDLNSIKFFVQDEGVGIPEDKKELIFERFEQINQNFKVNTEGTGLGLAICKGIIDQLEGSIEVSSKLGEGTRFNFVLPLSFKTIEKSEDFDSNLEETIEFFTASPKPYKILVAEDNQNNMILMKSILNKIPIELYLAHNGNEAIKVYQENPSIDLILMDIRMPEKSGDDACREILKIDPKAKVIAQTAFAMSEDQEQFLKMGFVDYISKPLDVNTLLHKMKKAIES